MRLIALNLLPEMAVVSRITFFKATVKDNSPESPVAGSWPGRCQLYQESWLMYSYPR